MSNYWECMKLSPPANSFKAKSSQKKESDKRFEAYKKAHEIRQFEIKLFWQRATYYWAFILAAFTTHFALIGLIFNSDKNKELSFTELYNLPGLSIFALAITTFFCYFFSLCWVLMNKGSKFWQKNWEKHIDELQNEFSGDLYKVILNTENKTEFDKNLIKLSAYDYSVSKITSLTSIVLMGLSLFMFIFYFSILAIRLLNKKIDLHEYKIFLWAIGILILLILFIASLSVSKYLKGNISHDNQNIWRNRDE